MAAVVGLYNGEDIALGGTFFNKISDDQCAWIITDLEGWWGLPDVEVTDDPKTQSLDGSYFTFGRHLPRTISMRGQILPLDGAANKAVAARSTLNRLLAPMARNRVLLSVQEDNPKVSLVQLAGQPLTTIDKTTGQLTFDIVLRAVDPVKYSQENHIVSTSLAATAPGRTYNKTFYYSYGGKTTDGQIAADNIGSYSSDATFTITGPVTRPRIEHVEQGVFLEFNVVLGIGETLTINTRTKKILFGGASRRNTLTPQSRWFTLTPGRNTIRYSGTQQIPAQVQLPAGTNLLTNPSFEATSGTVEVRRNYATKAIPTSAAPFSFSTGTGQVSTHTIVTGASDGPLPGVTSYQRRTITTPKTGGTDGYFLYDGARYNPAVGAIGTASLYLRASVDTVIALVTSWRDGSNNSAGTVSTGNQVTIPAGQWVRISGPPVVASAGALGLGWWATIPSGSILPAGATIDATAFLADEFDGVRPYFDGSFSPDSDLTASWTGAANASPSVLTGATIAGALSNTTRARPVASTQWKLSGARSVRIIPVTTDSFLDMPTGGLVVGQTYTLLGTIRLDAPQTGPLYSQARGFVIAGGDSAPLAYSITAPNEAGVHEVRATFVANRTSHQIRFYNGAAAGGGDVWWDNVMLVEGNYSGDYFDGSSPFASWTGTPNASTSTRPFVPEVPETMLQLSYRDAWID